MLSVRTDFPFFKNNPGLVYLDSASTTQKPQQVIDAITHFYTTDNANSGRGNYPLATRQTKCIETTRQKIQMFVGAKESDEIIFTTGATIAMHQLAFSLAESVLKDGDEILYCPHDHNSFIEPLTRITSTLKKRGITITLVPYSIRNTGGIDIADIKSKVSPRTKVVWATHVHNIFGTDSDIAELKPIVNADTIIVLDATQSIGHMPIDVAQLGVDALICTGHKMLAGTGIGFIYLQSSVQARLRPFFVDSGYEVGTAHLAGIASLNAAITYLNTLTMTAVHRHIADLTQYTLQALQALPHIEFTPGPHYWRCQGGNGILAFQCMNLPATEVGFILAERNICVRTGDHCTFSTHHKYQDTIRVSMHIYNTKTDIDYFVACLAEITT